MKTLVVKLDSSKALVFDYPNGEKNPHVLEEKHTDHHTHGKHEGSAHQTQVDKFFHVVAEYVKDADEVFVVGQKMLNSEFKHHLENHHHQSVLKKVIGMDTIDSHASNHDVMNKAHEFFKHYRSFTPNY